MELLATNLRWLQVGGRSSHKPRVAAGGQGCLGSQCLSPAFSSDEPSMAREETPIDVVVKVLFSLNVHISRCFFHTLIF